MTLRFEEPVWFWLLAAALPLALVAGAWFTAMSPTRRWSALLLRLALLASLTAMLAGASMVRKTDNLAVIALVDVSGSVRRFGEVRDPSGRVIPAVERARTFLEAAAARRGPDDFLGIVAFGAEPVAVATPSRADVLGRDLDIRTAEGTDLAHAIRLARAMIPPDAAARLVVISDGNQTSGDAVAAANEVAQSPAAGGLRVPIDVVPIAYTIDNEVAVELVDAPPAAAGEAPVSVRVVLSATAASTGTLRLLRENAPVDIDPDSPATGRRVSLRPGLNVQVIDVKLPPGRVHRFRAVYEPDVDDAGGFIGDTVADNNRGEAFTITPGRGSVLLVDGADGDPSRSPLLAALTGSGIEVRSVVPEAMPADPLSLEEFDAIILQNVPAELIPAAAQQQLLAYVRDMGGGLIFVGGPDAFGAGGWKGSVLEPVFPVRLDLPDRVVIPEAATIFVIDNSGSMARGVLGSTRSQQEVANDATALAIQSLDPRDLVGIITFNSDASVRVRLAPNTNPQRNAQIARGIGAGGGTNMPPALEEALAQLNASDAKIKHIVVLSDGRSQGTENLPALASRIARDGIRISTIAVGSDADLTTMAEIARRGNGAYYYAVNPSSLPRVFLKAVRVVRAPLIREEPFDPIITQAGSRFTAGIVSPPTLEGLVLTDARPEPTIVRAMITPTGEPLLAHWQVGLGQAVAFTSDTQNWARAWLAWPQYQTFWSQLVRAASRPTGQRAYTARSETVGGSVRFKLEALDDSGRPVDGLFVPATVFTPQGEQRPIRLLQTGPGLYEAALDVTEGGSYVALIKPERQGAKLPPAIVGSTVVEGAEYRARSADIGLLTQVAERTGGRVLDLADPAAARLFSRDGIRPREASTLIWRTLLVWAIVLFLLDIATRRVAWDRWVSRRFGAGGGAEAAATPVAAEALRKRVETVATSEPSLALSAADAEALANAARDRRRAQRLQGAAASTTQAAPAAQGAGAVNPVTKPEAKPESKPSEQGGSSLLAAKRRAAERFNEDEKGT